MTAFDVNFWQVGKKLSTALWVGQNRLEGEKMIHILEHSIGHAFIDTIKIMPFIFLIYLVIEYLEHKNNTNLSHKLMGHRKRGAVYGAILGSIPQCGFSVIAADLYSRRAITLGTLIAIFVATSDEAIPIILTEPDQWGLIIEVIGIKIVIAVICGIVIDLIYSSRETDVDEHSCHRHDHHDHFHGNCESCEGGFVRSAVKHTVRIFIFLFIVTFVLTAMIEAVGEEQMASYLLKGSVIQPFIASLIGLIPNCAASVMITEAYLSGAVTFGSLIAGLSSGAGVGVMLLFQRNRDQKQNVMILLILYLIGAISGLLIQIIS